MKHYCLLISMLLPVVMLGCQGRQEYDVEISEAHRALSDGYPELAEMHLEEAKQVAAEHKLSQTDMPILLRAEAKLQQGDLMAAEALGKTVLDENVPGTRSYAQAEELLAKIAIRKGRFVDAQHHLVSADMSYKDQADKERISDLSMLNQGFIAYSEGDIKTSKRYWQAIEDSRIRASLPGISVNSNTVTE